jgi:hypothetical protein
MNVRDVGIDSQISSGQNVGNTMAFVPNALSAIYQRMILRTKKRR